jgi:hypothetical protein
MHSWLAQSTKHIYTKEKNEDEESEMAVYVGLTVDIEPASRILVSDVT